MASGLCLSQKHKFALTHMGLAVGKVGAQVPELSLLLHRVVMGKHLGICAETAQSGQTLFVSSALPSPVPGSPLKEDKVCKAHLPVFPHIPPESLGPASLSTEVVLCGASCVVWGRSVWAGLPAPG